MGQLFIGGRCAQVFGFGGREEFQMDEPPESVATWRADVLPNLLTKKDCSGYLAADGNKQHKIFWNKFFLKKAMLFQSNINQIPAEAIRLYCSYQLQAKY
ncbi:hypothetical protein AKJ16_DCAP09058 [Drosera capensis]